MTLGCFLLKCVSANSGVLWVHEPWNMARDGRLIVNESQHSASRAILGKRNVQAVPNSCRYIAETFDYPAGLHRVRQEYKNRNSMLTARKLIIRVEVEIIVKSAFSKHTGVIGK